jgi:5-methylcytosine-specific restriction endonuclease McrA
MDTKHLEQLTDAQLLETAHSLAARERAATAELIAALAEVDARRLYLGLGYSSMFAFCTARLRLSESAAYARIEAARVAVRFPLVFELLRDGSINLTTVSLLAPHLTEKNHEAVLRAAIHGSKREVEVQIAALRPAPPVPVIVRKRPQPRALTMQAEPMRIPISPAADPPGAMPPAHPPQPMPAAHAPQPIPNAHAPRPMSAAHAPRPTTVAPLSPERYKLQVTISRETHDKLRRAQNLLRHSVPDGDVADILDRALTLLVEKLEKQKCGSGAMSSPSGAARTAGATRTAMKTPRETPRETPMETPRIPRETPRKPPRRPRGDRSRHVPASVRREVWTRDGGQCAFVGTDGRCPARAWLEFHHVVPYADGGATNASNLQLRCRAHNQYEGELMFGPLKARESSIGYSPYPTGSGPS